MKLQPSSFTTNSKCSNKSGSSYKVKKKRQRSHRKGVPTRLICALHPEAITRSFSSTRPKATVLRPIVAKSPMLLHTHKQTGTRLKVQRHEPLPAFDFPSSFPDKPPETPGRRSRSSRGPAASCPAVLPLVHSACTRLPHNPVCTLKIPLDARICEMKTRQHDEPLQRCRGDDERRATR